jgi:hypothetical protein
VATLGPYGISVQAEVAKVLDGLACRSYQQGQVATGNHEDVLDNRVGRGDLRVAVVPGELG